MASRNGTDPAKAHAPVPLEGDGAELLGMVVDGRYRLDATLGRGGMGLVFKAHHMGLRRAVAVKVLHRAFVANPDVRNRFEREALASGKIDHPNCVNVYDTGRLPDGSLYLAMELLDGKSLADVLEQEGQLAPGRALHILAHVLRGLAHVHAAGLIHRDIKPENIFLITQGEDHDFAKILDFGIAKGMTAADLDDGVKLTQAGMAFGTPIYIAPEQALGNPMDGRADLYAAAVVGFEMLCGQPPFYSDDKLEVMAMHTARPVPPMRQRLIKNGRPVPASIERLIVKGLTKKPSERYPTADVFLAAVENALHTPDGGVTDVAIERPSASTTGSQPLIADDGSVNITGANDIADAIDEALSTPRAATAAPTPHGMPASLRQGARLAPQGGVSIGLPYTGPQGEPIFGLTPEQRLAQATAAAPDTSRLSGVASALEPDDTRARTKLQEKLPAPAKKSRWLYGAIAAAAVAAGVVVAVVTSRPEDSGPALDPDSPAGQAKAALDRGDPAKAVAILEGNKVAIANDAMAQLILGHAHAARHASEPSLVAYGQALQLDPKLEADAQLRAGLRAMAADTDVRVVAVAFELWVSRTTDPEAKPLLVKAAISDNLTRRHAVKPVVERLSLNAEVDWLLAFSWDLEQEATCELRKEAVAKLRALNDRRAVPALERAVVRKIKSGALRGKTFSPCLVDDAKAAIGYLRGLPAK
ncbi:MAG: serine/threonine-protein kinase [Kofleriaceae bacterium]|nr:serine/threonine-protein kinase [Kofleriaceae bacterium]